MPTLAPDQLAADVDFLTQQPEWQDKSKRTDFIRQIAIGEGTDTTPDERREVAAELWKRSDTRGTLRKGAEFVGRAGKEVAASIPASGGAALFAIGDAAGITATGSGTRLKRGVVDMAASAAQTAKQLMPGKSNQAVRDEALDALKADIDDGAHPAGLETWLAGGFDEAGVPDAETQQWIDGLTTGFARKAVAADYMGKVDEAKVKAYLSSDRNPAATGNDQGPGPREMLADYVATRDPRSWDAFKARVTETDNQAETRNQRFESEYRRRDAFAALPEGVMKDLAGRSLDMQTSPLDLASAALPFLRGSKALRAARAGGMAATGGRLAIGAGKEALQEGITEKLQDPRASNAQVLEAAAMGAIGSGAIEAGMAGTGALLRQPGEEGVSVSPSVPAPGASGGFTPAAASTPSPSVLATIAQRGGRVDVPAPVAAGGSVPPVSVESGMFDAPAMEGDVLTDFAIQGQPPHPSPAPPHVSNEPPRLETNPDATPPPQGQRPADLPPRPAAPAAEEGSADTPVRSETPPVTNEVDLFGAPIEEPSTSFLSKIETQEVPLSELTLSKDVPQFKGDADSSGVVEPLQGKYERIGTGPIIVWERLNGTREVISGRHRFDLAKRTGEKTIPAQVLREADGLTAKLASTLDAELNIRDGQGTIKDYANYFRNAEITDTEAEARGIRARAKGRAGWIIGTQAGETVFGLHANDRLTDQAAEQIARAAPGNDPLQRIGVQSVLDGGTIDLSVNLMRAMQSEIGGAEHATQIDLFGKDDSAMQAMRDQAKRASKIQSGIREQISAAAGAAKNPKAAAKLGVNVNDPAAVQTKLAELRGELARWDNWPLHEDLRAQVRGETAAAPIEALLQGTESTRPMNPGETVREQAADPLAELSASNQAGEAERAQGKLGFTSLNPSGTTAGFLNVDIINEAVDLIAQGVRDFAAWAKAMLAKFGNAVRDYLQGVWQAAMKTSQSGFLNIGPGSSLAQGNPFHRGRSFRVRNPNVRALLTGSVLPAELNKLVTANAHEITAMRDAAAAIGNDLDRAMQAQAKQTGQTEQSINDRVNAALEGTLPLRLVGNAELQEAVRRTRNMLDDLSTVVGNQTGGNLGQTILNNLGSWMRRSYAAFDPDAHWNYDALTAAAKKGQQIAGVPAAKILNDARRFLQNQNPQASPEEITADMRSLMDRTVWENVMTGGSPPGVRKDVTSLMRRKDIPPEIRALMGEERNPVKRFLGSTRFQTQYIARHQMQQTMRDMGLASGLFSATRVNEYTEPLGEPNDRGRSGFSLNGNPIYTTPELKAALEFAPGAIAPTDVSSAFLKALHYIGGQAKLNKVALSPDSWMVNMLGNVTGLVQTGNLLSLGSWTRGRRAIELMRSGSRNAVNAAQMALRDRQREMMARLTAAGVADSSLNAALVEDGLNTRLVQFIEQTDVGDIAAGAVKGAITGQALGAAFGAPGRVAGGLVGSVAGGLAGNARVNALQGFVAKWMMQNPDRMGKIMEFLDNYEVGLAAGLADQAAFDQARDKTTDTMPDYSKLPALLRGGSRLGVLGSFIAFQYEVYRNAFHNMRYGIQELRSGNPALMAKGARRLMGQAAILALAAGGLPRILGRDSADEKEKDEAWRRSLGRPWEKFSNLAYRTLDKDRASFFNTSYLLPQATMTEIWNAAVEGKDFDESMDNIIEVFSRQFAETGIHIDPLLSALRNQTRDGRPVSNEEGLLNFTERLALALAPMVPGAADKAERILRSGELLSRPRWDREFSLEEEGLRLLGVRQSTYTHERRMAGKIREFHDRKRAITDSVKSVWGETGGAKTDQWGKEKQTAAVTRANERMAELKSDWQQFEKDMGTLGISPGTLQRVRADAGGRINFNEIKLGREGVEQGRLSR